MTEPVTAPDVAGQKILVTGGAGFIGSHLVDTLVQSNTVTVLDNLSSGSRANVHPKARFIEGDVRSESTLEAAMDGVDIVFHQAGQVSVEQSTQDPTMSQAVNVAGTVKLLDCARRADARVVAASSAAVYGQPSSVPIDETEPLEPASPYGVDKLALDHYTTLFAELYDLPTVVLRYFNAYGPRQSATRYSGVISTFLEQAHNDVALTVHGDGSQTRDFVHVNDVVRANLQAAQTDHTGQSFNVGTGQSTTINELADTVCSVFDSDSDVVHTDGRVGDIERSRADITRAQELLGFEPEVGLEAGLETLVPIEHSSH